MGQPAKRFDATLRTKLIARLRAHAAASNMNPGPLAWSGEKGSVVGCIIESDDLQQWEQQLGLPQWLAVTTDTLSASTNDLDAALAFGVSVLETIPEGADLGTVGSRIIMAMLTEVQETAKIIPAPVASSFASVLALHQRVVAQETVAAPEWREVRKAASATTDAFEEESPEHNLGMCAESAAWDALRSSSTINDVMRLWQNAVRDQATREAGWTDEIDRSIRARLQEVFDVQMGGVQGPTITVFDMLRLHHPNEYELLLKKNTIDDEVIVRLNARARALLLDTLANA